MQRTKLNCKLNSYSISTPLLTQVVELQIDDVAIDFTKLDSEIRHRLTDENTRLRKDMYVSWAKSADVDSMFQTVLKQVTTLFK